MAFLRAGHSPKAGQYKDQVAKSLEYLLGLVEAAPEDGPKISDITGTQPQAKMGQNVDTALCSQLFSRMLPEIKGDEKLDRARHEGARQVRSQDSEVAERGRRMGRGRLGSGAPVLAHELISRDGAGRRAPRGPERARQVARVPEEAVDQVGGKAIGLGAGGGSAGVDLYSLSSNVRATAAQAEAADQLIADAKKDGRLKAESRVTVENLMVAGLPAAKAKELGKSYDQNAVAVKRMSEDAVLAGFGSNGGEEFLSYMQKSEALLIGGGDAFGDWNSKMNERLQKIQNTDGSWSGHHCITSPVFCTSAVLLTLAAERDGRLLKETAKLAAK